MSTIAGEEGARPDSDSRTARAILVLFFAALAAIFVFVDWTILTGLLAFSATVRAVFVARRYALASRVS